MKRRLFLAGAALVAAFGLSQCGDKEDVAIWDKEKEGAIKVAATTTMVADMVSIIGGDKVDVYGVMGEGIDPHSYEQTPKDTAAFKSADVIFYNGLHLEGKVQDNLEKIAKKQAVYAVTVKMPKSAIIQPSDEHEKYDDPHVWGDPVLWSQAIDVVVEGLSKEQPDHADEFKKRGDAYRKQLLELDAWAKKRINELPVEKRVLVTSHDAFNYYARAFQFKVESVDGLAPEDTTSVKKVEALVELINDNKIKTIFAESATNNAAVKSLAEKTSAKLSKHHLFADATGKSGEMETVAGETYDLGTYIGMVKHNVNAIVEGLK